MSDMQPGRRAREERLVAGQLPDYKTDGCGEPSDAGAEEVRTYVSHGFVVAAVSICSVAGSTVRLLQGPALEKCRSDGGGSAYCAALPRMD